MKHVKIVRNQNGVMEHYVVNLKDVLSGNGRQPFWLQPNDIVFVPEKFSPSENKGEAVAKRHWRLARHKVPGEEIQ